MSNSELIRDTLTDIHSRNGDLTADMVVNELTPDTHPLHDQLEWDNRVAGHKFRRVQAARMIRTCTVKRTRPNETKRRVFHSVRVSRGSTSYQTVDAIIKNPAWEEQVVDSYTRQVKGLLEQIGNIKNPEKRMEVIEYGRKEFAEMASLS